MKKQDMTDESSSVSLKEREITAMELTAIRGRKVLPASLAALYAGVANRTILSMARDQEIPHHKRGKLIYFKTEDLDRWMMGTV